MGTYLARMGLLAKDEILKSAPFDPNENLRIYEKFFSRVPRKLKVGVRRYHLDRKKVLDVGCSYGNYLIHFGPNSVGLDIDEHTLRFA